jgi:hypothetical protein
VSRKKTRSGPREAALSALDLTLRSEPILVLCIGVRESGPGYVADVNAAGAKLDPSLRAAVLVIAAERLLSEASKLDPETFPPEDTDDLARALGHEMGELGEGPG